MSATRRRRQRRDRQRSGEPQAPAQEPGREVGAPAVVPLPAWQWRTFPVFFALAVGLFLGTWLGVLAGFTAGDDGNETPMNALFIVSAILMGLALSRLTTRWLISRQWVRPRPKRRR